MTDKAALLHDKQAQNARSGREPGGVGVGLSTPSSDCFTPRKDPVTSNTVRSAYTYFSRLFSLTF